MHEKLKNIQQRAHEKMNNILEVSIIMNCLNGEKYLKDSIGSIYSQTYDNWEIIFWDNASTDRSDEIAQSYDSRLKYFRSDETYSLGKARNLAVSKAKGEYIAFLDVDPSSTAMLSIS